MALSAVANMLMPAAHQGMARPPLKKRSLLPFFREKKKPRAVIRRR